MRRSSSRTGARQNRDHSSGQEKIPEDLDLQHVVSRDGELGHDQRRRPGYLEIAELNDAPVD